MRLKKEKEKMESMMEQRAKETQEELKKWSEEHQSRLEDVRRSLSSMVASKKEREAGEDSHGMAHALVGREMVEEFQSNMQRISSEHQKLMRRVQSME